MNSTFITGSRGKESSINSIIIIENVLMSVPTDLANRDIQFETTILFTTLHNILHLVQILFFTKKQVNVL